MPSMKRMGVPVDPISTSNCAASVTDKPRLAANWVQPVLVMRSLFRNRMGPLADAC
jgi:hypothetical protein